MTETQLRDQICILAKSMFDRDLTGGSTCNISARTEDGGLLVSPTDTSFGRLDPTRLALLTRGMKPSQLTPDQIQSVVKNFDVEWDN